MKKKCYKNIFKSKTGGTKEGIAAGLITLIGIYLLAIFWSEIMNILR